MEAYFHFLGGEQTVAELVRHNVSYNYDILSQVYDLQSV